MPHKHKRRKIGDDGSEFDLPPSTFARALPAYQGDFNLSKHGKGQERAGKESQQGAQARSVRKEKAVHETLRDDTPRAFHRIMMMQERFGLSKGLDTGNAVSGKKRRRIEISKSRELAHLNATPKATRSVEEYIPLQPEENSIPRILPGERLRDYYARVDQALPLSEVSSKSKRLIIDGKEIKDSRETKHNKRLRKKQENWRKEDEEYKRRLEEEKERLEEEEGERRELYGEEVIQFEQPSSRRRMKLGEISDNERDPWEMLKYKREAPKGLHDVVQAPPKFERLPREIFKIKEGARVLVDNVPNTSGSLHRREQLGETRKTVIERYRQMMREKRS